MVKAQAAERMDILSRCGVSPTRWICWMSPSRYAYKANFDAAAWEDGGEMISRVDRDYTGKQVDCTMAFEAKLRDAWETLCLLQAQLYDEWLWIERDTLSVIEEMTASKPQSNPSVLLEDARLLVQSKKIRKTLTLIMKAIGMQIMLQS